MIKAVLLDVDGVLVLVDIHYQAMCAVFQSCGLTASSEAEWRREISPPFTDFYFKRGVRLTSEEIWKRYNDFISGRVDTIPVFDDVIRVLPEIAKSRMLGIVSGGNSGVAEAILTREGLSHHFQRIATGVQSKSDEITRMLEVFEVSPSEAMYVGDICADMKDAVRAGVIPVASSRGISTVDELISAGAKYYIDDFNDLLTLIGLLDKQHMQNCAGVQRDLIPA